MDMNMNLVQWFINERENVRTGAGTDDHVLLNSRFCNIRREDDRVSQWIFNNCSTIEQVLVARIVNHVDRLEELRRSQWSITTLMESDGAITNSLAYQFYPKKGETIRTILEDIDLKKTILATQIKLIGRKMTIKEHSYALSKTLGRSLHFYMMMVVLDAGHMGLADIDMNSEPYMGPGGAKTLKRLGLTLEQVADALKRPLYEVEHICCEVRKYMERVEGGIPNNRKYTPSMPRLI